MGKRRGFSPSPYTETIQHAPQGRRILPRLVGLVAGLQEQRSKAKRRYAIEQLSSMTNRIVAALKNSGLAMMALAASLSRESKDGPAVAYGFGPWIRRQHIKSGRLLMQTQIMSQLIRSSASR